MGEVETLKVHPVEGSEGSDRHAPAETGIVVAQDAISETLMEPLPWGRGSRPYIMESLGGVVW
ncbi:hypothetical protein GGI05_002019 [Coemansia sp. RSA 2603]|nr:hypothetical protein GGI05_002019 [Coemansia sp. RSA 2603]